MMSTASVENVPRARDIHVFAGVTCQSSEALVDTAAEDAVIGEVAGSS